MLSLTLRARVTLVVAIVLIACAIGLAIAINIGTAITARGPQTPIVITCAHSLLNPSPHPLVCASQSASTLIRRSPSDINEVLAHMRTATAVSLVIILVLGLACTYWVTGRALDPVKRVSNAAKGIDTGTLNTRLALRGPRDPLKDLADAFDAMLDRLEVGFERERRFASDASHELRTPLAIMRTNLDVVRGNPSATINDYYVVADRWERGLARMEELTDGLLALAGGAEPSAMRPIPLDTLVHEVVAEIQPVAQRQGIALTADAPHRLYVNGQEALLRRAVGNLVANGIQYNRPNGSVCARLFLRESCPVLAVSDTGLGIPPSDQKRIFERFYRIDRSRARAYGGAGLGLALVAEIARWHRGSLTVVSELGAGSTFEIRFPPAYDSLSHRGRQAL
ncbi:MAG: sensor histidine kinase [Chloroflexota bacterium]